MGSALYDFNARADRAHKAGFKTKSANEIFTQNIERKAHPSMIPLGIEYREARDSEVHPASFPIILGLDVTGSMGHIPHLLVRDGLPNLMNGLISSGMPDAAILFLGIGDHEYDRFPLQVGQFESGDAELDMWLTRTYIESGGGGNAGESYLLAWYFAAFHTRTDAWEKRKEKGLLFTIGDEPCLHTLPAVAVKEIMGLDKPTFTHTELLAEANKRYDVYHIHLAHNPYAAKRAEGWKQLMGDNCLVTNDHTKVNDLIVEVAKKRQEGQTTFKTTDSNNLDDIKML